MRFLNSLLEVLPGDPEHRRESREVHGAIWSPVRPEPVSQPRLLLWNTGLAGELGIAQPDDAAAVFAGNRLLPGSIPHATCYGGHQFGQWAGQLGDGRATGLGELATPEGPVELQLKGAGRTPYSRFADGRAVLRSSLREYLCSEAMHALGIPTTRALALVATGESVTRDLFYDGHPQQEPGAILTRTAATFLRFGHLELPAARGDVDLLRRLMQFVLQRYGPPGLGEEDWLGWYDYVVERSLACLMDWMRVGFVHGVLNTDNLSLCGLTIDYGPFGWLENYDPAFTPNTSDRGRRYCYANQPPCVAWNLVCLANALVPLVGSPEPFNERAATFQSRFERHLLTMRLRKLGLPAPTAGAARQAGNRLVAALESLLEASQSDFTLTYRALAAVPLTSAEDLPAAWRSALASLQRCAYSQWDAALEQRWVDWLQQYRSTCRDVGLNDAQRCMEMNQINPAFVPRNYLLHRAVLALGEGDAGPAQRILEASARPYETLPAFDDLRALRPDWATRTPGCSALSCSS